MAKRRRLTPAREEFLDTTPVVETSTRETGLAAAQPARSGLPPIAQVAGDSSTSAALTELTEAMARARREGRLVQALRLDEVEVGHLVRDRLEAEQEALEELVSSLRRRGQQTPIEVVDRGEAAEPRYGLISGWRRLAALRQLRMEDDRFDSVLALIRSPQSSSDAYVAMVEENEIRVGLSYYERARIVVKALEQGVYTETKAALQTLFENVSRAKRSKIKSFMTVVETLDGSLRFPTAIGERLGLELARGLAEDPTLAKRLAQRLEAAAPASAAEEQALLTAALAPPLPETRAAEPREGAETREVLPGLKLSRQGAHSVTLKGRLVDAALLDRLEAWLAETCRQNDA